MKLEERAKMWKEVRGIDKAGRIDALFGAFLSYRQQIDHGRLELVNNYIKNIPLKQRQSYFVSMIEGFTLAYENKSDEIIDILYDLKVFQRNFLKDSPELRDMPITYERCIEQVNRQQLEKRTEQYAADFFGHCSF